MKPISDLVRGPPHPMSAAPQISFECAVLPYPVDGNSGFDGSRCASTRCGVVLCSHPTAADVPHIGFSDGAVSFMVLIGYIHSVMRSSSKVSSQSATTGTVVAGAGFLFLLVIFWRHNHLVYPRQRDVIFLRVAIKEFNARGVSERSSEVKAFGQAPHCIKSHYFIDLQGIINSH
jgi:hypothetical protein